MSNRTPSFRSWKRAYGGDPDSTILRDLHRRLMKVEIAQARLIEQTVDLLSSVEEVHRRLHYVLVAAGGTVGTIGGDPPPPPPLSN